MKNEITDVQIITWKDKSDNSDFPVGYIGVTRFTDHCHIGIYHLTKRNYWRAVKMQLHLAGFADSPAQVDGSAVEARQ